MRRHLLLSALLALAPPARADAPAATPVAIPDGAGGIGFDDLGFAPSLRRVLAPAGRTGCLALIDPASRAVQTICGFSKQGKFGGGHGQGTTSADEGRGRIFASDRGARQLVVIDEKRGAIVARAPLADGPDYVRWVEPTGEAWVTEPHGEQIEIFAVAADGTPRRVAAIKVPGGPESLVIDPARGRAYTHSWKDKSFAIDLKARKVVATFPNGCKESRGIALDGARALLLVGCDEGRATVLDLAHDGKLLATLDEGKGVDVIADHPGRRHLYLPGADGATMGILGVGKGGALSLLGRVATAPDAHCVAADDGDGVWVCDPKQGRLLRFADPYPQSAP